jgi:ribosomal-protein-alanine N-acetyltransferase
VKPVWDLARLQYEPMQPADLLEVAALEASVYPHPWSLANFEDSLRSRYQAWVLRDQSGSLLGYFLVMAVVDEAHLLNVAVAADQQGKGWGVFC